VSDATTNTQEENTQVHVHEGDVEGYVVELCPAEQLEELRDAEAHAQQLEAEVRSKMDQAKLLRSHAWTRVSRKLSLSPSDSIDLGTGAVTRGKPDEVRS